MFQPSRSSLFLPVVFAIVFIGMTIEFFNALKVRNGHTYTTAPDTSWHAPSLYLSSEPSGESRSLIIYGEDLIANTSRYFGPRGKILRISNGMNCQNCHLDAGTRSWGNNYAMVYSTYPKFRARSGSVENLYKRVSDCFERSLNGTALDSNSREYLAISAYINWIGANVQKGKKPEGTGIEKPAYLKRAADPKQGALVYSRVCSSCHGAEGQGAYLADSTGFGYPPLWGPHSYTNAAGLYRLSAFAGFVKNNMPYGQAFHGSPKLSDEDAWDVAAFVNSQPRPVKDQLQDWPKLASKPVDHPYGPYVDSFSEQQHKYGPFLPIVASKKE